ncbi:Similar to MAX: Protein max (Homo sapiens), partial [Cotesia congregata]
MSDDDRDIDIESDDGDDSDSRHRPSNNTQYYSQAEKRAHHNALERKRRDHIKDSFSSLRDTVPSLQGEKVASRAQILKKAAEYIQFMRRKNSSHQQDIDDLKRQNILLESQSCPTDDINACCHVATSTNFFIFFIKIQIKKA